MAMLNRLFGTFGAESEPEDLGPTESRHEDRAATYKIAELRYPTGYIRRVIVADMSEGGIRIRSSERGDLPATMTVKIDGRAPERTVELVWQTVHEAGLQFID